MTKTINKNSKTSRGQTNIQTIGINITYCPNMSVHLSEAAGLGERGGQKV